MAKENSVRSKVEWWTGRYFVEFYCENRVLHTRPCHSEATAAWNWTIIITKVPCSLSCPAYTPKKAITPITKGSLSGVVDAMHKSFFVQSARAKCLPSASPKPLLQPLCRSFQDGIKIVLYSSIVQPSNEVLVINSLAEGVKTAPVVADLKTLQAGSCRWKQAWKAVPKPAKASLVHPKRVAQLS